MSDNKVKGLSQRYSLKQVEKILKASEILKIDYSHFIRNSSLAIADKVIKEANRHKEGVDETTFSKFLDRLEEAAKGD